MWGQMASGGGHSQLEETLSVAGVPVMTKRSFINTERDIGEMWRHALNQCSAMCHKNEKQGD